MGNLASTGTVPLTGQLRPHQRSVANIGTVPLAFTWLITPGLRYCPNTIGTVATVDYARPAGHRHTNTARRGLRQTCRVAVPLAETAQACHVPATVRNLARGIGG